MGRGSTNMGQNTPGLVLECETEELSQAQLSKKRKAQDDIHRLHILLNNTLNNVQSDNAGTQAMVNGGSAVPAGQVVTTASQPITSGANVVGLQMPHFLLLQNGQMIATTALASNGQICPTTSATSTAVVQSSQQVSAVLSLPQPVSVPNKPKNTAAPPAVGRPTRVTRTMTKTVIPNPTTGTPDIQVLREMRTPPQSQASSAKAPTTTAPPASATVTNSENNKNFPMLSVTARPKNTVPPAVFMAQRKELDAKVKSVLVKTSQEFVEWLLGEGLIRTSQFCPTHKQSNQTPVKLKLGMFSDPKVLTMSGGYVWLSECCGKKYVSVFSGSLFGSTPIDKVPPTSVLKLIYHWSCQTSIANVETWVKVDKNFINKMYQYMRCICSVMLQDKVYDFGFDGTTVELGIVSLGTSTADGTKKAVKVEILGLYDRKMKSYRLFASEPEPGSSSRQRFIRILKPMERVVHANAIILCDLSVDRNCLYNMNYAKVSVCETSDNEDNLHSNARIMSYLRRHVPKMFQSTLSQLTLQQVQVVLDELCWRERYGHSAAQAYNNMMEHITYLTAKEAENPGVLHLLDFVSQNPLNNWRYKSQHFPRNPTALQPSVIMTSPGPSAITPQISVEPLHAVQSPVEHSNKVTLAPRKTPSIPAELPKKVPKPVTTSVPSSPDAVELEPFYYGQIQGDKSLGQEVNTYTFTCHICQKEYKSNLAFYAHLKLHLNRVDPDNKFCCNYCTQYFDTEKKRDYHHKYFHLQMDNRYTWCRICTESFQGEYQLVNHMAKKHYESELPYRCEVCNFATSIYYSVVDHFKKEHENTPYVQCHYCLSVKTINSASASSFSHRMYQHLQKHASQQGNCRFCCLTFYSKYLLDEHKKKDHVSRANVTGLQRYKVPQGANKILFRPCVKRGQPRPSSESSSGSQTPSNIVAISSTQQYLDNVTVNTGDDDKTYYCIECDASLTLEQHFKAYQKCTKCTYATCCRSMISKHAHVFHPMGRTRRTYYNLGPPIVLPKPLFCICGFSSRSGNHLARHLALCDGGRKSAYPSVMDAMVYRGDHLTGGAVSLANLGLGSLALSGMLAPELLPQASDEPGTETSIDMTHFMSMSMEVDDE